VPGPELQPLAADVYRLVGHEILNIGGSALAAGYIRFRSACQPVPGRIGSDNDMFN